MRRLCVLLPSLVIVSCTSGLGSSQTGSGALLSSVSSSSSISSISSNSSSINPKTPKIYLQWQVKNLPELIKGTPRRKLSLIVSGAHRQFIPVGTFSGKEFDLKGVYVNAPDALLKASIAWKGSGDEIWIEKDSDTGDLDVHHRNLDEEKRYLSVDRILTSVDLPDGEFVILPRL